MAAIISSLADQIRIDPAEIDRRLDEGTTLPAELYTDPRVYELEQALIFRRAWSVVAAERQVRDPGDFVTGSVGEVPVVIVRDEAGTLRAHVNVCRHRAHPVAVGSGNRKTLQCRYHGWTYDLSGELLQAPRSDEASLEFCDLGLRSVEVDTFAGLVFVSLEPQESLAGFLGELPQLMESKGYDYPFAQQSLVLQRRLEFSFACNWKISIENSLECYHCPTIHPLTFADVYRTDKEGFVFGNYDRGCYHTYWLKEKEVKRLGLADDRPPDLNIFFPWPTIGLSYGNHSGATIKQLIPRGPEECVLIFDIFGPEGEDTPASDKQASVDAFAEASSQTFEEDRDVCANVYKGLRSGAVRYGVTLPETETNIRHFQRLTWSTLRQAFLDTELSAASGVAEA